jgi:hypothetical protein
VNLDPKEKKEKRKTLIRSRRHRSEAEHIEVNLNQKQKPLIKSRRHRIEPRSKAEDIDQKQKT